MQKLLLINNSAAERAALAGILSQAFVVLQAEGHDTAMALMREEGDSIALIIMSAYLPKSGDTQSLIGRFKGPVIVDVSQSDKAAMEEALAAGAYDFIIRPYNPILILRRISNVIEHYKAEADVKTYQEDILLANRLVNDSSSSVYVCDTKTYEILYLNRKCASICGKKVEDAKGRTCYEFLLGKTSPCEPCLINAANSSEYMEREFFSENSGRHYMTRGKLIDWGGKKAFVEYLSDETERILVRNRTQDLLDKIPAGLGIYNLFPDNKLKLLYLNDGYYTMLGTTREKREKYRGYSFIDALHPDDVERTLSDLANAIKTNGTTNTDLRIKNDCGEYIWVNTRTRIAYKTSEKTVLYVAYINVNDDMDYHLQLEASHRVFDLANREGSVSLWLYDLDKKRIAYDFINANMLELRNELDRSPESIAASGVVMPEDIPIFLDACAKLYQGENHSECDVRLLKRKTKTFAWYKIIITRFLDEYYEGNLAFCMLTDVNTQHQTRSNYEREISLRKEMFKHALTYYTLNLTKGVFEEVSSKLDAYASLIPMTPTGPQPQAMILNNVFEDDRESVKNTFFSKALLDLYQSGERKTERVYRRIAADGTLCWAKATATLANRPDTEDVIAFIYVMDIDREVNDKNALSSIIDTEIEAACLINTLDLTAHLLKANTFYLENVPGSSFPYSLLIDTLFQHILFEEDYEQCREFFEMDALKQKLRSNKDAQLVYRAKLLDGSLRRKRVKAFFLYDNDETKIVMTRQDITQLFEAEQQQKATLQKAVDAANKASRAKSDFISRVSHDMRTPLNAILGLTALAKDETDPVQTQEYLDHIENSGSYLLGLINDILDLSRIESGKIELEQAPFPISEFHKTIDTVVRPLMEQKNISFVFEMGHDTNCIVADKNRFCQIFINLLNNAAKFTPCGGKIEFTCERIPDDAQGRHGMRYHVKDNGCGMSQEFLTKLFEPFTQEHNDSGDEIKGSGLGLAIVKKLVDAFGGKISVKSELGKGTEFIVDMYAYFQNDPPVKENEENDFSRLAGMHILLVDDNQVNILVSKKLLEAKGIAVDTATNGLDSIEKFKASKPGEYNAILMDIRMPVMDGIEATKSIRVLDRPDAAAIPIIATTANALSEDREKTLQAGMSAHLSKPIVPGLLYSTLLQLAAPK